MSTKAVGIVYNIVVLVKRIFAFFTRKKIEKEVREEIEKEQQIETLKENEEVRKRVDESREEAERIEKKIGSLSDIKVEDADLSRRETERLLNDIRDTAERQARKEQIDSAKEIKKRAERRQAEIEKDERFNNGEEIIFKG